MANEDLARALDRRLAGAEPIGSGARWEEVRGAWDSWRSRYWMSKGVEAPPVNLEEQEIDGFQTAHPEYAAHPALKSYWANKISNGEFTPYRQLTERELKQKYPRKRIWRSWELQLWRANMGGFDMHTGIEAEIESVELEGRWVPEALPFIIFSKPGFGPAIPYPAAGIGGQPHHHVEFKIAIPGDESAEAQYEEQRRWWDGYFQNFRNKVSLALMSGGIPPRDRLKLPDETNEAFDEELARKVKLEVARLNPALATNIKARLAAQETSDTVYELHESLVHRPRPHWNKKDGRAM